MQRIFLLLLFALVAFNSHGNALPHCTRAQDTSRVVSVGGSVTEVIFYLNLESNLVARDITSNFPPQALELPSVGYVRSLSTEGVLSVSPTLILGESEIGPPFVIQQFRKAVVDFRIIPDTFSGGGIQAKVRCVGQIFGLGTQNLEQKLSNLSLVNAKIKRLKATRAISNKRYVIILMMRGTSPFVAGAGTSGDGFIKMLGGVNAMARANGWKPVGIESIIGNEPDVIIVTERAFKPFGNISKFLSQTGLSASRAGKIGAVLVEDGMSLLGFGPRTLIVAQNILNKVHIMIKE